VTSPGSPYRPSPPRPRRLNHVALLALAVLSLVTASAVVVSTSSSRSAISGADTSAAVSHAIAPQRPSFPSPAVLDAGTPRPRPEISQHSVRVSPVLPHAVTSRLLVREGADTGSGAAPAPLPLSPHSGFLSSATQVDTSLVVADVHPPATPYVIESGTAISATLVTEIRSTLPGLVVAQVAHDVYDTPSSRWVLIPRGSRLIGRYDSQVAQGEDALLVVWTRLTFPDGRWLSLPGFSAADAQGTSGLRGSVDTHMARAYLDAGLLSLVGAGAQLSQPSSGVPFASPSAGQVLAGSVGQQLSEQSLEVLRADSRLTPVITVRGGTSFVVMVARDLVFDRPY
jgi:type IV secretory pathway VirB10-like protein